LAWDPPEISDANLSMHLANDGFGQLFVDFVMSGYGLRNFGLVVGVPIVRATVAYKDTTHFFENSNQIASLHATTKSSV
jgi:hypothetical protein